MASYFSHVELQPTYEGPDRIFIYESFMDESQARKLICEVGALLYSRSYVVSSDGNVSIRLGEDRVLATPTMTCKGRMTEDCLAITDMEGRPLTDKKASSELAMHLLIYKERPDIRAVCHAHPPHGTAFSVAGLPIDKPILSEVILTLGCVPLTDYGTPSTSELTDAMRPFVKNHNALLMANHGAVAYGEDLWQAFDRLETLEHTARIAILAKALGGANDLPADAIEKLINIREKAGYLNSSARCQACGYLHQIEAGCDHAGSAVEANGVKVAFTREELIELLSQAAGLS
ncbi:MAG: class II aldolase/adducin family protein [Acidobacteriota bacterium]